MSDTLKATGGVVTETVGVAFDVMKGAIAATEEVGTGLILSTKSVAKGVVMGVSDVGNVIPRSTLQDFQSDRGMLDYMRMRTYILSGKEGHKRASAGPLSMKESGGNEEIVPPVDAKTLAREISFSQALLLEHGEFQVLCAEAWQIPRTLWEIGRPREMTFRQTSEGTGKTLDLDEFDSHYLHLFLWNKDKSEIAGAYRLGQTDRILKSQGIRGLYTGTLFRYDQKFLNAAGMALELGRSFIRPEYQKSYSALLLLWKGIGYYVSKKPAVQSPFRPCQYQPRIYGSL